MSVLIHEQGGRRTIYYPDDRHLLQYAESGPTLISIEILRLFQSTPRLRCCLQLDVVR
jgi:hypothetical protein